MKAEIARLNNDLEKARVSGRRNDPSGWWACCACSATNHLANSDDQAEEINVPLKKESPMTSSFQFTPNEKNSPRSSQSTYAPDYYAEVAQCVRPRANTGGA